MIIGISGKAGSGKDTTGDIIQYVVHCNNDETTWEQWSTMTVKQKNMFCNWKIKKFADKLKDITCILLGCTREQLEDRYFKEKELGEEWNKNIFDGLLILEEFDEDRGEYIYSDQRGKELGNVVVGGKDCYKEFNIKLTPRKVMQLLGTEGIRNVIHQNSWVNALMSEYKPKGWLWQDDKVIHEEKLSVLSEPIYPSWLVTDLRFPNELQAVKDRGGISIRVNRHIHNIYKKLGREGSYPMEGHPLHSKLIHPSETALDDAEFDYVIDNNGTIEDLIKKVKNILIKEKIID